MPPKRPTSKSTPDAKSTRSDRSNPDDFSSSIKKKLSASTRTGQACDRCKVRKIRCDGRAGGCSPCLQANTECRTTDRITGRATTRGHTETLESENRSLRQAVAGLQQQLKELGIDAKPADGLASQRSLPNDADGHRGHETLSTPNTSNPSTGDLRSSARRPLPKFRTDVVGDNYLGVSSGSGVLSPIKGTSLSLFGMELDLAELVPDDEFADLMSYEYVMDVAMSRTPPHPSECRLPDNLSDCEELATLYLRYLMAFIPTIDRRDLRQILYRVYHHGGWTSLTVAERVMVQMMLATTKHQTAVHQPNQNWIEESHGHFRFALSCFYDLVRGHTLEDIQALVLICYHMRNYPKPGAAWIFIQKTFALAIELGLHRSAAAWYETGEKDKHIIEKRKRTFWTIHSLHVLLSGKLGRPMPIRLEDVDIEFFEPLKDSFPEEEDDLSEFAKCSFRVGIHFSMLQALFSKMYSTIYAVRVTPQRYEQGLKRLEEDINQWEAQIPQELDPSTADSPERIVAAHYLRFWRLEFELLLHHPAVYRSKNSRIWYDNLRVCRKLASEMLVAVQAIQRLNSLDLTWTSTTVYLAAMFTNLFAASQMAEEISATEFNTLRQDSDAWCLVIRLVGRQLGCEERVDLAVRTIAERALQKIRDRIAKKAEKKKSASTSPPSQPKSKVPPAVGIHKSHTHSGMYDQPPHAVGSSAPAVGPYCERKDETTGGMTPASFLPTAAHIVPQSHFQQTSASYSYNTNAYTPAGTTTVDGGPPISSPVTSSYTGSHNSPAPTPVQVPPAEYVMNTAGLQSAINVNLGAYGAHEMGPSGVDERWHNWTGIMAQPPQTSQDYMNQAQLLLNVSTSHPADGPLSAGGMADGMHSEPQPLQWPTNLYGMGRDMVG